MDLPAKSWSGEAGFHPNHRLVFTSDYDGIAFWDLATKRSYDQRPMPKAILSSTTRGTDASSVAFSPDGLRMATGHPDGTILLWDSRLRSVVWSRLTQDLETMWTVLKCADAAKAWQLIWRLADSPAQALACPAQAAQADSER